MPAIAANLPDSAPPSMENKDMPIISKPILRQYSVFCADIPLSIIFFITIGSNTSIATSISIIIGASTA